MKANGADWKEVKLGRILRYLDERLTMDDEKEYLTIRVKRRHGGLEIRERLFGHQIATKKQFRLVPGAFIISRVQCWHQAYAIVGDVSANTIASTNYDQFAISPEVDPHFFWWLSHSPAFTETVRSSAVGVVIEKMVFSRDQWLTKSVRLPPLAEQRRVVARIEELVAQINEARALRPRAADQSERLIASARSRFFPVTDECPGLAEVCRDVTDGTHDTPQYVEEGIPFLTGRDISPAGLNFDGARFISEEDHKRFSQHCPVEVGDVLLTLIGTIDKVAIVDTDRPFSIKNVGLLKPNKRRLDSRYLFNFLRSSPFQEQAVSYAKSTAQAFVGLKKLRIVKIPVPPLLEQRRIVVELDALQAEVDALKRLQAETAAELDALLPSILDKAFKGEL